jgi:outer membrane protein OmpA-like peptidoglycan-associated protein
MREDVMRFSILVGLGLLAGCSPLRNTKMVAVEQAASGYCAADADCGSQQLCVDRMCHNVADASACGVMPVHFATDSAALDARNRAELDRTAVCLRSNQSANVSIAGNADERGNSDYNRSLAQRRADAVAQYLEADGVPAAQLSTVTYGADDPLCNQHAADCWRQNRRVEIRPSGMRAGLSPSDKNKNTTDNDAKSIRRIDSTGNGTDNGTPLGK